MVVKINICLSKEVLEKLDEAAREANSSRSALLTQAIKQYLEEKEKARQKQLQMQAAREIDRIRESVEPWDATAEVLKWRDLH